MKANIISLGEEYNITMLAADKNHAYQLGQELAMDGWDVQWVRQGRHLSPAVDRLEKLVIDDQIVHEGNPVQSYCLSNVRCENDAEGNRWPSNKLPGRHEKMDVAINLLMALLVQMFSDPVMPSVYEEEGAIWL